MEVTITILIYIHAIFGGIGLISGIGNFVLAKRNRLHKKLGRIFSYSMIISSLTSLVIAKLPHHENLFLFLIGIFTIYMVLSGNRALTFKRKTKAKADVVDLLISGTMLLISIGMSIIGVIGMVQKIDHGMLYLFFGSFGILMTLRDFWTYKMYKIHKNAWLKSHIGRMVGALIASVTAFIVAGLNLTSTVVWLVPTLIGTAYIIYWNRKLKSPSPSFTGSLTRKL